MPSVKADVRERRFWSFTDGWWSKQVSLGLAACWSFCSIIPRQGMRLFKVCWPMCFEPLISFKRDLIWSTNQAILFWFLLLKVDSSSANPRVLPFRCFYPVLPVFPPQWGCSDMVSHTLHHKFLCVFCHFLPQDHPVSVNLVLFSGAFLNLGSSASFISTFLTLRATVTNENSQQHSQYPALKSSTSNSL